MNKIIPKITIDMMREQLINQRVAVTGVTLSYTKYPTTVTGICTNFGYNKYLPNWGLCITVNNLPINNIMIDQIIVI